MSYANFFLPIFSEDSTLPPKLTISSSNFATILTLYASYDFRFDSCEVAKHDKTKYMDKKTIRLAVFVSGNGTNLENIIKDKDQIIQEKLSHVAQLKRILDLRGVSTKPEDDGE